MKRLPGEIRRFLPPRLAATRSGVVVLHSAHLEGEPAAPERDYRVVAFDASGAILSTRAVDLDSRNGFYTQLASGRDDRLFVAGEDLGEGRGGQPLVLEIVPAGKTGLTGKRALAGDVAPIGSAWDRTAGSSSPRRPSLTTPPCPATAVGWRRSPPAQRTLTERNPMADPAEDVLQQFIQAEKWRIAGKNASAEHRLRAWFVWRRADALKGQLSGSALFAQVKEDHDKIIAYIETKLGPGPKYETGPLVPVRRKQTPADGSPPHLDLLDLARQRTDDPTDLSNESNPRVRLILRRAEKFTAQRVRFVLQIVWRAAVIDADTVLWNGSASTLDTDAMDEIFEPASARGRAHVAERLVARGDDGSG